MMRVGPYLYCVKYVKGYLWHEGQRCLGLCDNDQHKLLVSDVPSQAQQVQVICHEYIEAWLYHFGGQLNEHAQKEMMCDLFGMAMAQFAMDYMQQMRQWGDTGHSTGALIPGDLRVNSRVPREQGVKGSSEYQDSASGPLCTWSPIPMNMHEQVERMEEDEPAWRVRIYEPVS